MDTKNEAIFLEFIHYNNWANQEVLRACQGLSDEQLDTNIPGAYGTIRATLEHIIRAEAGYLRLLTGIRPQPPFNWDDKPDLAAITQYSIQVGNALVEMAGHTLPTHQVKNEEDGKIFAYQALAVFIQIINHGVEHRTNITTLLNLGLLLRPKWMVGVICGRIRIASSFTKFELFDSAWGCKFTSLNQTKRVGWYDQVRFYSLGWCDLVCFSQ
jgi:uncharacterized damage-inducible protein DinB